MMKSTLYLGNCVVVLRNCIKSGVVDLVYADPPFATGRNFEEFDDRWDFDQYLVFMKMVFEQIYRVLKISGTAYIHCDPTASHYLKIGLDDIFGKDAFRNEIIWYYRGAGVPKKDFSRRHDVIFRYCKSGAWKFDPDPARQPYATSSVERFSHFIGNVRGKNDYGVQILNPKGKHPDDVFTDIQPIAPSAKERLGYPTQKPRKLLDRIIETSTEKGDTVLDPFCGSGTTLESAYILNRYSIGIDSNKNAIDITKNRLERVGCRVRRGLTYANDDS